MDKHETNSSYLFKNEENIDDDAVCGSENDISSTQPKISLRISKYLLSPSGRINMNQDDNDDDDEEGGSDSDMSLLEEIGSNKQRESSTPS